MYSKRSSVLSRLCNLVCHLVHKSVNFCLSPITFFITIHIPDIRFILPEHSNDFTPR